MKTKTETTILCETDDLWDKTNWFDWKRFDNFQGTDELLMKTVMDLQTQLAELRLEIIRGQAAERISINGIGPGEPLGHGGHPSIEGAIPLVQQYTVKVISPCDPRGCTCEVEEPKKKSKRWHRG